MAGGLTTTILFVTICFEHEQNLAAKYPPPHKILGHAVYVNHYRLILATGRLSDFQIWKPMLKETTNLFSAAPSHRNHRQRCIYSFTVTH